MLDALPYRLVQVEPRRPFREPGAARDEVMFVRSGIIAKFKPDASGGRQIVALRFPGEGILPRNASAHYRHSGRRAQRSDGRPGATTSTRWSSKIRRCGNSSAASSSATRISATSGS